MMKLVFKKRTGMAQRNLVKIACNIYASNCQCFINTKADPFAYLNWLREDYGIVAAARPVVKDRRIIGYKFKAVA